MSTSSPTSGSLTLGPATRRALARMMPLLLLFFIVNYLDRVNIGFAAQTMNADLGMSVAAYGLGAAVFFISYIFLEIPSNWIMQKIGAKAWLIRILLTWGVISSLMCLINSEFMFYALRVLLGAAEAGFIPAIHYMLANWFPNRIRGRVNSIFYIAMPVATVIGAPLSSFLIQLGDSGDTIAGWRLMFLLEGIPAIVLGIVAIWVLSESPAKARWLTVEQRDELQSAIAEDRRVVEAQTVTPLSFRRSLTDPRVLIFGFALACYIFAMYALGFYLPLVIAGFGGADGALPPMAVGLLTMIPYAAGTVAMLLWGRHSDRKQERAVHFGIGGFVGAAGIVIAALSGSPVFILIGVTIAAIGLYSALPPFWSMPSRFLSGASLAGGIAMINSLCNVGGFATSYVTGSLRESTGSYTTGFLVVAAFFLIGAVLGVTYCRRVMKRADAAEARVRAQEAESGSVPAAKTGASLEV